MGWYHRKFPIDDSILLKNFLLTHHRMDYSQQMPMNNMGEMQSVEQTLNMSPMDLFDSIFWGKLLYPYPHHPVLQVSSPWMPFMA